MLLPEPRMWDTLTTERRWGPASDLTADSTGGAYFTQADRVYYASPGGTITLVGETCAQRISSVKTTSASTSPTTRPSSCSMSRVRKAHNQREFAKLEAGQRRRTLGRYGRQPVRRGRPWRVRYNDRQGKYIGLIPTPPGRPTGQALPAPTGKTLYVWFRQAPMPTDAAGGQNRLPGSYPGPGMPARSK